MGPKVEAACRFVERAHDGSRAPRFAAIGACENAAGVLRGDAGTRIVAG
jgi:carbamate kinase